MTAIDDLPPYQTRSAGAPKALEGLRVVDFTQFIAGPYCTLILADFGADILKIENPSRGDDLRGLKNAELSNGDGGPFLWANRNKRSVTLDLAKPAGRDVARELIKRADIVVENFSAGVMKRFGLDYETVSKTNPGLIYCSISAAGREGPLSQRVAFDPISQAESGFISLNTAPGAAARALYTPISDLSSGMMAAMAILAAVAARARLGKGQFVEIAMLDQSIHLLSYHALNALMGAPEPPNSTGVSPGPAGIFRTSDSEIFICCANDRTFRKLVVDVLQRPDIADDPRYITLGARIAHAEQFLAIIEAALLADTRENWLARMRAAGVPVAPIATVMEALVSPEAFARGLVSRIDHPAAGYAPHVASPFRMSLTPIADPIAAPALGEHTREVLKSVLGYDDHQVAALSAAGALGAERS